MVTEQIQNMWVIPESRELKGSRASAAQRRSVQWLQFGAEHTAPLEQHCTQIATLAA